MNAGLTAHRILHSLQASLTGHRAPAAVAIGLVAVLGWQAAGVIWRILPAPDNTAPAPIRIDEPDVIEAGSDGSAAPRQLARLHLFGERPASEDGEGDGDIGGVPADAPVTQLDLELKGLYAIGDGGGFAIIIAGDDGEQVFGVGDNLPGNATVAGVYGDRVLLRRDGNLEALWLGEPEAGEGRTDNGAAARANQDEQQIAQRATSLRERLLEDPAELARMVRFQPYQRDNELVGFRLRPRDGHGELLRELGLTPDDVLTQINGIPLNDTRRGQEALDELRSASQVQVQFLRDGQQQQMTLSLE